MRAAGGPRRRGKRRSSGGVTSGRPAVARRRRQELFPGPLQEFVESEWPPVPGECLMHYTCRGNGYDGPCVPRPGESCGQLHYEMLARDYPGQPERLARARTADAYERWKRARMNWLGEDHPGWLDELCRGWGEERAIRYGP